MFETIDPQWGRDLILPPVPNQRADFPRLSLERIGTLRQFISSVAALVRGPVPPKEFLGDPFFRDCWIERKLPKSTFAAAIILQALLIRFPPPIWKLSTGRTVSALPPMELTWYGPIQDFPLIAPPHTPKPVARKEAMKAPVPRGSDAFHPRQTILSEPLHPTHPRQALIQSKAPLEPPKILPALPNIVQLAASQPVRPKMQLTAGQLAALRPKTPRAFSAANVAAPEISNAEKQAGVINIATAPEAQPKPLLPVNPIFAPRAARQRTQANAAAPDVGRGGAASETLIALSAKPAPVAPPPAIPAGNLSARVSISPDGSKPGAPQAGASSGGGARGPEAISISGGNGKNASPASGLGVNAGSRAPGNALPSRTLSRLRAAPEGSSSLPPDAVAAAETTPKLGMSPQTLLGAKRVYTLHINMPNLTSASGSWILNFAELNELPLPASMKKEDAPDLAGPMPLKKVDPKYPPELRSTHVDGEVVLYAIIRKDGNVDSIQLVKSIDPVLDANAMEALAQWKFRPAEKNGAPVDLEAVVYIPFRSRAPAF